MVKFDEKGQGFWDFILENFPAELIKEIEFLYEIEEGDITILSVDGNKETNYFKVYLTRKSDKKTYWILNCSQIQFLDIKYDVHVNRFSIYELQEIFGISKVVELIKNDY